MSFLDKAKADPHFFGYFFRGAKAAVDRRYDLKFSAASERTRRDSPEVADIFDREAIAYNNGLYFGLYMLQGPVPAPLRFPASKA